MRRTLIACALCACVVAPLARADGDPASDFLYTQQVFVPIDIKASSQAQGELARTVAGATREGFPIRVAVIGGPYDLGSVPSLWRKPQTYARFLGAELAFVYKQRLLIVMPNGFGFYWKGHDASRGYATLAKVKISPGADGLVEAGRDAVVALAGDAGVHVAAAKPPKSTTSRDRVVILLAAIVLIAAALIVRVLLRRGRRA